MNPDGSCPTCGARLALVIPAGAVKPDPGSAGEGTLGLAGRDAAAPSAAASEAEDAGSGRPARATDTSEGAEIGEPERTPVPWHFTLLLVALVLYLGFRAYEGVAWVVAHLL